MIKTHVSTQGAQPLSTEQKELESIRTLISLAKQMRVMINEMVSANIMDGLYDKDLLEAEDHLSDVLFVNLGSLAGQLFIESVTED